MLTSQRKIELKLDVFIDLLTKKGRITFQKETDNLRFSIVVNLTLLLTFKNRHIH